MSGTCGPSRKRRFTEDQQTSSPNPNPARIDMRIAFLARLLSQHAQNAREIVDLSDGVVNIE